MNKRSSVNHTFPWENIYKDISISLSLLDAEMNFILENAQVNNYKSYRKKEKIIDICYSNSK